MTIKKSLWTGYKRRGPVTWVIRSLALSRDNRAWNRAQNRQRREMGEGMVQV